MTGKDLCEKYINHCSETECENCEYNIPGQGSCELYFSYQKGRADAIDELVYFVATRLALTHIPADERATFCAELDIKARELKEQNHDV